MAVSQPPFQRFLDAHREDVWRFLVASVGRDAADDCFQETFLAALRAYPRLRPRQPARVGADHRPPQGARPPPRAQRRRGAGRRRPARRRGAARPRAARRRRVGTRPRAARPSSAARCCCASPATSATREVAAALGMLRGGRAPQRLRGPAQAATGDDPMTEDRLAPPTFDPADAARGGRALRRRRARRRRTTPCVDSPVGTLVAAAHRRAASPPRLRGPHGGARRASSTGSPRELSPRILEAPARLDDVRRELDEYFAGAPARLRPADRLGARRAPFGRRVLRGDRRDPVRRSVDLRRDGRARPATRRASRAAGNALGANPIPIVVPCHRVSRAGGRLGGYTGGLRPQGALLGSRASSCPASRRPPGRRRRASAGRAPSARRDGRARARPRAGRSGAGRPRRRRRRARAPGRSSSAGGPAP